MKYKILQNEGEAWRKVIELDSKQKALDYVDNNICKTLNVKERQNGEIWVTDDEEEMTLSKYKAMIYETRS